ncbi:MAG: circularly permuted type 2 ATP-grasp protein [Candidatus Xenobia bacterium]
MAPVAAAQDAVSYYHELMKDPACFSDEHVAALQERMREERVVFGDRYLCPFLRPHFITASQLAYVKQETNRVLSAVATVERLALASPEIQEMLDLTEREKELAQVDPRYQGASPTSRMDTFVTEDSFHFVEYNAECPAGIAYNDKLLKIFLEQPIMRRFTERFPVAAMFSMEKVYEAMTRAYRQWGGQRTPQIAIIDWRDVPTYVEFEFFQQLFESHGSQTIICDPRELELRNGELYKGDFRVDIIYKRVLTTELLAKEAEVQPLLNAYRQQAACFINSFRCKLLHKKLLFAVLSHPQVQKHFTGEEMAAVREHIPWTHRVVDGKVDHHGQSVDLCSWILEHRDNLVLKPNDEYGGKGIFIGWDLDAAAWEKALQTALHAQPGQAYVVQEKVKVGRVDFPDRLRNIAPRIVDLDPFIFTGEGVTGFLTRLSDTSLCNVTSGGGQVPTFILQEREG